MTRETVYIKAEQSVEVKKRDVTLGDVASFECPNPSVLARIKTMRLFRFAGGGQKRCVVSILKIIERIHEKYPGIDIQNLGEADVIITLENQETPGRFFHFLKVSAVVLITFAGAAFAIMTFHNDVDTVRLFGQIYELLMGEPSDGFTLLELTYSVGLIIGILVFFNHFGGKKFSSDPTPMEVEMRLYETDIQTTLIENYSRKEQEMDVG